MKGCLLNFTRLNSSLTLLDTDMDRADRYGRTALHLAMESGYDEPVKSLLARGASVSIANRAGETALDIALGRVSRETTALLLENGAANALGLGAIVLACERGQTDVVAAIFGRQIRSELDMGYALSQHLLQEAVAAGNLEIARVLIRNGAYPYDAVAVRTTKENGRMDILQMLKEEQIELMRRTTAQTTRSTSIAAEGSDPRRV